MLRITLSANGSLYCCSDGVRGRGAAVKYLSHNASFHSKEKIAPSNRGIKQLGGGLPLPPARYRRPNRRPNFACCTNQNETVALFCGVNAWHHLLQAEPSPCGGTIIQAKAL